MQTVKESLEEGYCDVSGRVGDMTFIGEPSNELPVSWAKIDTAGSMADIKVYVSRGNGTSRNIKE